MVKVFAKSFNHKYLLNYKFVNEKMANVDVFFVDLTELKKVYSIEVIIGVGGDRIAISDDGKYLVTALYEKKFFVYELKSNKMNQFKTNKNIDNVEIINQQIYIFFSNGKVSIYDLNGNLIETKASIDYVKIDLYGDHYLINDEIVKIHKNIKPLKNSFFYKMLIWDEKIIVSELDGRLACYNMNGQMVWEYLSKDNNARFYEIAYFKRKNVIAIEVHYIKQQEKILLLDATFGNVMENKDINAKGIIFLPGCECYVDDQLNVCNIM